jgi:hypothetical protein
LEVDIDFARNGIVLRHSGFTVEMQTLDDLVLLHSYDRLCLAALVRNVKFVKRSGVRTAIRLGLGRQLLDDLHLFKVDHADRVVLCIRRIDFLQFWNEFHTFGSRYVRYGLDHLVTTKVYDV